MKTLEPDSTPYTELCTHSLTSIHYRNESLVDDILGKKTFTEVMFSQITGREASAHDLKVIDAALIAIMEHGLTPSAIATRLVYMSSPENIQSGVAAGLLAVGSQFIGTVENCAVLLQQIIDAPEGIEAAARTVAQRHRAERKSIPASASTCTSPTTRAPPSCWPSAVRTLNSKASTCRPSPRCRRRSTRLTASTSRSTRRAPSARCWASWRFLRR